MYAERSFVTWRSPFRSADADTEATRPLRTRLKATEAHAATTSLGLILALMIISFPSYLQTRERGANLLTGSLTRQNAASDT